MQDDEGVTSNQPPTPTAEAAGQTSLETSVSDTRPIGELMTRQVVTLDPQNSLWDAAETLRRTRTEAAAVCAQGRFIGLITERDIAVKGVEKPGSPRRIPIQDVMQTGVPSCTERDALGRGLRLMLEHRVRWIPVLDGAQHLIGLLSADRVAGSLSPRAAEDLLQRLPPAS